MITLTAIGSIIAGAILYKLLPVLYAQLPIILDKVLDWAIAAWKRGKGKGDQQK